MRYPASEKLEIIRLVERSHLPVRRTLDKLGIPATTFYRWYDRYRAFGEAGLEDRTSGPGRIWNRIPDDVRRRIVDLALDEPELSPRELAVTFTDTKGYFVSEASVYRLLKAHDLITSPAFVVIKAADEFRDKTAAPNQLWQTDFTYLNPDFSPKNSVESDYLLQTNSYRNFREATKIQGVFPFRAVFRPAAGGFAWFRRAIARRPVSPSSFPCFATHR